MKSNRMYYYKRHIKFLFLFLWIILVFTLLTLFNSSYILNQLNSFNYNTLIPVYHTLRNAQFLESLIQKETRLSNKDSQEKFVAFECLNDNAFYECGGWADRLKGRKNILFTFLICFICF